MNEAPVVTELVVTSDNAGAVDYARAMAAAQEAAATAIAANDNWSTSMRSANDNARDAAEQNGHVTLGLKQLAEATLDAAEAWAKKVAIGVAVVGILGAIFRVIMPLYIAYKLIKEAIDLVTDAWTLSGQRLADYVAIADKASKSDLSTDFFQRISKAAEAAKLPVDDLQAALKKLTDVSADKLGGSDGQNRLDALTKAGNFQGNTGVAAFAGANTTEERFRAIVSLIDQAMQKGERLAALDVSKTFLGDAVTANLAKDQDYLDKMLKSADAVKSTELISEKDVGNALVLQQRLDAAEKILSERWHPIQNILIDLGLKMREGWVNIVEAIAAAFDWLNKFVDKLSNIPKSLVDRFVDLTTTPESRAAAAESYGLVTDKNDPRWQMDVARQRLAAQMNNPANMMRARDETNAVQNAVFKDTSKDPDKKIDDTVSAYDRAEEALLKYIEVTKASAAAVGQSASEQERARAIAQLTAAGLKDGLSPAAAKAQAEMSGLGEKAAAAADALAKAKVASSITFNRDTALLSSEDVQIAQQLKSIYGNDVPKALDSSEAAAIRFNDAMKGVGSSVENNLVTGLADATDRTKSWGQAMNDTKNVIIRALEEMIIKMTIVTPIMRALQAAMSSFGLGGGLGSSIMSMLGINPGNALPSTALAGGGYSAPIGPTIGANADGTDFWRGGLTRINEEGGEIVDLPTGSRVIPHDVSMAMARSGQAPVTNVYIQGAPSQPTVTQKQNGTGGRDIMVDFTNAVVDAAAANVSNGGKLADAIANRTQGFGAR